MSEIRIGRVYKIIHTQTNIIYVGSTFNSLRDRFYRHKSQYKLWLTNNETIGLSIYSYFKEHDFNQFKIILIKDYNVIDRNHLEG